MPKYNHVRPNYKHTINKNPNLKMLLQRGHRGTTLSSHVWDQSAKTG